MIRWLAGGVKNNLATAVLDGLELLERISVIRPELPVVVMTVDSTAGKIVSAIKKHAFGWLQKPFTMLAVQELVDSALTVSRLEDDIQVISATPQWLELRLRCDMKTAWRALHFVREMDPGLPDGENVALAFREVLFNAVEHGGGNDPNVHVTITYTRAAGALLFRVRDPGPGFSFEKLRQHGGGARQRCSFFDDGSKWYLSRALCQVLRW